MWYILETTQLTHRQFDLQSLKCTKKDNVEKYTKFVFAKDDSPINHNNNNKKATNYTMLSCIYKNILLCFSSCYDILIELIYSYLLICSVCWWFSTFVFVVEHTKGK